MLNVKRDSSMDLFNTNVVMRNRENHGSCNHESINTFHPQRDASHAKNKILNVDWAAFAVHRLTASPF